MCYKCSLENRSDNTSLPWTMLFGEPVPKTSSFFIVLVYDPEGMCRATIHLKTQQALLC